MVVQIGALKSVGRRRRIGHPGVIASHAAGPSWNVLNAYLTDDEGPRMPPDRGGQRRLIKTSTGPTDRRHHGFALMRRCRSRWGQGRRRIRTLALIEVMASGHQGQRHGGGVVLDDTSARPARRPVTADRRGRRGRLDRG
jgi:hypothetical protein